MTTPTYTDTTAPSSPTGITSWYKVTATNTAGESAQSTAASATRTSPPGAPTGLTASTTTDGITLTWGDVAGATAYNVYRSASADGTYDRLNTTLVTTPAYTDTTAPSSPTGTTSCYKVTAVTTAGESAQSTAASATRTSAPAAPTGLAAAATPTGITLTWTGATGATGYRVSRSGTENGTYAPLTADPITATTYADTTAPIGTSYYRVTAVNTAGASPPSNTVSATRVEVPAAPIGLTPTPAPTGITLAWTASAGATGYHVYRATSEGGTYARVNAAAIPGPAWDDTLAPQGTSYYRVTAVNGRRSRVAAIPRGERDHDQGEPTAEPVVRAGCERRQPPGLLDHEHTLPEEYRRRAQWDLQRPAPDHEGRDLHDRPDGHRPDRRRGLRRGRLGQHPLHDDGHVVHLHAPDPVAELAQQGSRIGHPCHLLRPDPRMGQGGGYAQGPGRDHAGRRQHGRHGAQRNRVRGGPHPALTTS